MYHLWAKPRRLLAPGRILFLCTETYSCPPWPAVQGVTKKYNRKKKVNYCTDCKQHGKIILYLLNKINQLPPWYNITNSNYRPQNMAKQQKCFWRKISDSIARRLVVTISCMSIHVGLVYTSHNRKSPLNILVHVQRYLDPTC